VVLLRKVIGDVLRARRLAQRRTLREVSAAANVSLGYLSEIERGHKEASSELLAAICEALGTGLSDVLADVSATFALAEQVQDAFNRAHAVPAGATEAAPGSPAEGAAIAPASSAAALAAPGTALAAPGTAAPVAAVNAAGGIEAGSVVDVVDGEMTVSVRSDGPLRTTLTARRTPGQRGLEPLLFG